MAQKKSGFNYLLYWDWGQGNQPLKAFIKHFEAPQRIVKIKIQVNFILIQLSEMRRVGMFKTFVRDHSFQQTEWFLVEETLLKQVELLKFYSSYEILGNN